MEVLRRNFQIFFEIQNEGENNKNKRCVSVVSQYEKVAPGAQLVLLFASFGADRRHGEATVNCEFQEGAWIEELGVLSWGTRES